MAVGDWVPCVEYGAQVSASIDPAGAFAQIDTLLVYPWDELGQVAEAGVLEVESEILVKRVVGWVFFRCAVGTAGAYVVHERIRTGMQADDGTQLFFATDFQDASEANELFLWERVSGIDINTGATMWPQPDFGHPGWGQIDVRVARKLKRDTALVYSVQFQLITAGVIDPSDVFTVFPHLRCWARALG